MTTPSDILLLGLPGTGKSTFLAALWGSIKGEGTDCALGLSTLGDEREYLEGLWRDWVRAEELAKTASGKVHPVDLHLLDKRRNPHSRLTLRIPDMSGETFREQFENRQWTLDFETQCAVAERVLLFVHVERINEGITLADLQHARRGVRGPEEESGEGIVEKGIKKWEIGSCRTQVQIVDLLQFLAYHVPLDEPRRVAVVISAWDLLDGTPQMAPSKWLTRKMSLVKQYLEANPDHFAVESFGVSAQGFSYEGANLGDRLAKYANEWDRVRVLRGDGVEEGHDITAPLQWLMDG